MTATANEVLLRQSVKHQMYVLRHGNQVVHDVMWTLNDALASVTDKMAARLITIAGTGREYNFADKRLQAVRRAISDLLDGGMTSVKDLLATRLKSLAVSESDVQIAALKGAITVPFDFIAPAPNLLEAIVESRPFEGNILSGWFDRLSLAGGDLINRQINMGLAEGESVDQLVRRVRGTAAAQFGDGAAGQIRRNVEAVVRTAVQTVTSDARLETLKENSDIVSGWAWCATLDSRTCPSCGERDGAFYPLEEASEKPPLHWNCRCCLSPVLKSWKDLGIDLKEAPAGTRASLDGQVPATMKYSEWIASQPDHVQDDALGARRAELFRSGQVTVDQFTDDRGKLLSLSELRAKAGL